MEGQIVKGKRSSLFGESHLKKKEILEQDILKYPIKKRMSFKKFNRLSLYEDVDEEEEFMTDSMITITSSEYKMIGQRNKTIKLTGQIFKKPKVFQLNSLKTENKLSHVHSFKDFEQLIVGNN